jgi:hypothetical protein
VVHGLPATSSAKNATYPAGAASLDNNAAFLILINGMVGVRPILGFECKRRSRKMIAIPKHSAIGLPSVTKMLVGTAIALVVSAAPAGADPQQPSDTHANPFAGLGCGCQVPASAGDSVQQQLARGILDGSRGVALPAPGTH